MTSRFIESMEEANDVNMLAEFIEIMWDLEIISQETMEDFDNTLHDECSICIECDELQKNCTCDPEPGYNREYDDESSFEE